VDPLELAVAGFDVLAYGARFDGVQGLGGCGQRGAREAGLTFGRLLPGAGLDGTGIREPVVAELPVSYSRDGWFFNVSSVTLSNAGVAGEARLLLPYTLGARELDFPSFGFLPDGGYEPGTAAGALVIRIHGWRTRLEGVTLDGDLLSSSTARLCSLQEWARRISPFRV